MSSYPTTENEQRIRPDELRALVTEIWLRCGMSQDDAALLADTLVAADLRGVHSHGVLRVPEYVKKLRGGGVDPKGRPRVVRDSGAALVVDGANSMGQIGTHFAMSQAIERARQHNIAAAGVRGSNHCGAMAYFAMQALSEDMIGIATTNALPIMAPWGGIERVLGINPLAVAIPAGEERPLVLDIAFSGSSHGKIRVYHQKGATIPPNWAFDTEGRPTTDPAVAMEGLLQPIGQYKGVGLALVMGILSSLLSGAAYGTELGDLYSGPKSGIDGHFVLALRIGAFEEPARFKSRVDGIIREIRSSKRPAGVERLYAPGELETETEHRYGREGIPLNERTLADIAGAAEQLGLSGSDLDALRPPPSAETQA
jgi:LDH2 family malate/lactate/ureidoglycolate dehydrogenase